MYESLWTLPLAIALVFGLNDTELRLEVRQAPLIMHLLDEEPEEH